MASLTTEREFRTACQWLRFGTRLVLMFISAAVFAYAETAGLMASDPSSGVPAFAAARHPDTIETRSPYQVEVRQISGPDAIGGYVEYEVWNASGKRSGIGRVKLSASSNDSKYWSAAIPGQSQGSFITYHYVLLSPTKSKIRHPSESSANYRFQVISFQLSSLRFQRAAMEAGLESEITMFLTANAQLRGEIILRLLPQTTKEAKDLHIRLQVDTEGDVIHGFRETARVKLPALDPGQAADFYFQFRTGNGDGQTLPADAPAEIFSVKRSASLVRCIPVSERFVLGATIAGSTKWLALRGGGAWNIDAETGLTHWGTCEGALSNISRFAISDDHSTFSYVGSDHGIVGLNPHIEIPVVLLRPGPSAWGRMNSVLTSVGSSFRVGPAAISTLDGTILLQYQQERVLEERYPKAVFLQIDPHGLTQYSFPANAASNIIGLSSISFDGESGCWLLGAFVADQEEGSLPSVVRRCGESVRQIALPDFRNEDSVAKPQRVIGIATDPTTSNMVVALEFQRSYGHNPPAYGVFRLEEAFGRLIPIASAFKDSDTEITCIETDWNKGRILVGTFGDGLWQIRNGIPSRLASPVTSGAQVTTLSIDNIHGGAIFGTSDGAYEINDQDRLKPVLPPMTNALPADSMPMDVRSEVPEVLFSSYSAGLAILRRHAANEWQVRDSWLAKTQVAGVHFGDAQFTSNNGIAAVEYSRGLLLADDKKMGLVEPSDSLNSANLFRVLALSSGEIWLAYRPVPFGQQSTGAVQMVRSGKIVDTFKMPDRGSATIARWIEMPERKSIFAATRDGVVEIRNNGSIATISPNPATSIARNLATGLIGAVGSTVERWNGQKFVPVFYQVLHPRWSQATYSPGSPIDVAIDSRNFWFILYNHGVLAILDSKFQFLNILDVEDGIPQTSQRLLLEPGTDEVFIGSTSEGVVNVSPSK